MEGQTVIGLQNVDRKWFQTEILNHSVSYGYIPYNEFYHFEMFGVIEPKIIEESSRSIADLREHAPSSNFDGQGWELFSYLFGLKNFSSHTSFVCKQRIFCNLLHTESKFWKSYVTRKTRQPK